MTESKQAEDPNATAAIPCPTKSSSLRFPIISHAAIIVAAAFFINAVYGGVFYVSGLYIHSFLMAFGAGKVTTAWVISLQGSLTYFSGIVSGPMIARFGTRPVAVLGSLSAFIGIFLSTFAMHIAWLYFTYGIMGGCGFGMMMISNGVCVHQHTEKRRALAAGLALCGSGVGCFVLPQICKWALLEYGWRGSLLIISGILLHTLPCALLLKSPSLHSATTAFNLEEFKAALPTGVEHDYIEQSLLKKNLNGTLTPEMGSKLSVNGKSDPHEVFTSNMGSKISINGRAIHPVILGSMSNFSIGSKGVKLGTLSLAGSSFSIPLIYSSTLSIARHELQKNRSLHGSSMVNPTSRSSLNDSELDLESDQIQKGAKPNGLVSMIISSLSPITVTGEPASLNLPIILVLASWFFFFGGMPIVYIFATIKAMAIGLGTSEGATLISVGGLGEISGRFLGSALGSCHERLPHIIFACSILLSAGSSCLVGFSINYAQMITGVVCFGTTMGLGTSVSSTVIRDIVGINNFPWVFGYAFTFGGIGNIFAVQIFALIWEQTSLVYIPFIGAAVFLALTTVLKASAYIAFLRNHNHVCDEEEVWERKD